MQIAQLKNKIVEREKILSHLSGHPSGVISDLVEELKVEHQRIIYALVHSENEKQEAVYHQLSLENERQMSIVNQYIGCQYQINIKETSPKKPILANVLRAFLVGGLICTFGQVVINYFMAKQGLDFKTASGLASVSVILVAGFLTGLGVYDEVGRFGGAGSMVPISGFSNSIVSAALEFKREGMIYGIGAKIFTVAGPVILYGTVTSVLVGLVAFLLM